MMTITLTNRDNARYKVVCRRSLLDELLDHGVDLPYGCRYVGCITCAAKLIEGTIDQSAEVALNNRQIDNGYIILCVVGAKTDCSIDLGMESHDLLYHNPFCEPLAPQDLRADVGAPKEA